MYFALWIQLAKKKKHLGGSGEFMLQNYTWT